MNNIVKSEKLRVLSILALFTGIGAYFLQILIFAVDVILFELVLSLLRPQMFDFVYLGATGLAITAIVCGSIDLKRIKAGRYNNKDRKFDIAGIVMGGVYFLVVFPIWLLETIFPH